MKGELRKQLWLSFGIIAGSFCAAAVALYFFGSSLGAQADEIVREKQDIGAQASAFSSLADLKAQAASAVPYETAMNKLLPNEDGLINFPTWLQNLGKSYNVALSASFQGNAAPAQGSSPGTVAFAMNAQGTPSDLVAFLTNLESRAPGFLVTLNSFDLTNQGVSYQIVAQGVVYFK